MQPTLAYRNRSYAGVDGYLRTTGLQPGDLAALRERFVDLQG